MRRNRVAAKMSLVMNSQVLDPRSPRPGAKTLPGGNRVDIVGESFYGKAIREVLALVGPGVQMWASLIPDPENPYDPNAVKVVIAGRHVGHLDRDVAIVFLPVARRIRELGCEAQCSAVIGGGGGRPSVALDLGTPDDCLDCLNEVGEPS